MKSVLMSLVLLFAFPAFGGAQDAKTDGNWKTCLQGSEEFSGFREDGSERTHAEKVEWLNECISFNLDHVLFVNKGTESQGYSKIQFFNGFQIYCRTMGFPFLDGDKCTLSASIKMCIPEHNIPDGYIKMEEGNCTVVVETTTGRVKWFDCGQCKTEYLLPSASDLSIPLSAVPSNDGFGYDIGPFGTVSHTENLKHRHPCKYQKDMDGRPVAFICNGKRMW